jgi:MFS transporter, PPP family, 3-phenylpropionic acid transporter
MNPPEPGLSPERRIAAYYATFFMSSAVWTVIGSIWLAGKGLSSDQIATIAVTPIFIMLVVNLVVGRVADRASDWRQVIVIGSLLSGVLTVGLIWAESFWPILIFFTLASIAQAAVTPVVDAAAMRFTQRRGRDFATLRAWGTIGYVVLLIATGLLSQHYGAMVFLPLFLITALARGAFSLGLPKFRAENRDRTPGAQKLRDVMKLWFILPLLGWAIVFSTHLILNSFQNLIWERQGLPLDLIGVLIAVGAACEALMFFAFRRFGTKYPARWLILASGVVSALRWAVMALEPGLPVLFALQTLHAITYALGFLACITFITKWTSEDIAAEAQSFFVVLQQGCSVIAVYGFGLIADDWGAKAYFVSSAIAAFGCVLILISILLKHPQSAPVNP